MRVPLKLTLIFCACAMAFAGPALAQAPSTESWMQLKSDLFGEKSVREETNILTLEAPDRAPDPAMVPVRISLDADTRFRTLTLIVDENPAPVAATFTLDNNARITTIETRLRVNAYSNIRVVGEDENGQLYMASHYVKASGGCAAPAARNPAESTAQLGQMRLRRFLETGMTDRHVAQLMIRHPNNSGLQRDQISHLYIPAHFVSELNIEFENHPFLSMEGGISISEDPNFRFTYDGPAGEFKVYARDTDGRSFSQVFAPDQT
ncbi:quinoprotein dehydrogenase-associated SoxYZ-like carrier [Aureimonas fodinaquatilis]|uniref:Quinoprotein dehydrogenase-associated SoxYZ-like carrier n=2 Tax=Aureimonas fodinaquatilis TaxID=2565783 RepID=A0A5B0DRN2_9HYPH|nr:quinoprotein dehydrogenase-associated SoxYZ-like carrier [Aureimonas fodinaquatilis]